MMIVMMMMRVMLMIDTMIMMIMISSLQHQYLNTHKSKSHGVCTEFKFHLRSEITLVPNTYEFIYDDSMMIIIVVMTMMVCDDDYSNDDIYDNN